MGVSYQARREKNFGNTYSGNWGVVQFFEMGVCLASGEPTIETFSFSALDRFELGRAAALLMVVGLSCFLRARMIFSDI